MKLWEVEEEDDSESDGLVVGGWSGNGGSKRGGERRHGRGGDDGGERGGEVVRGGGVGLRGESVQWRKKAQEKSEVAWAGGFSSLGGLLVFMVNVRKGVEEFKQRRERERKRVSIGLFW